MELVIRCSTSNQCEHAPYLKVEVEGTMLCKVCDDVKLSAMLLAKRPDCTADICMGCGA